MLFLLFSLCAAIDNDGYVSLDLDTGSAKSPSHIISVTLTIGRPEKRYQMLVDFTRNEIDMKFCMHQRSYTFDISPDSNSTSDVVMFSDDTLLDPVKRGIYRFPIREHCLGDAPFDSSECAALDTCGGVLGLGPLSPVWLKWSGATITRNSLHFGSVNPHRLTEKSEKVQCAEDSKLCSFNAIFAGRPVAVDFHSHDSYIYVPTDVYQRYTEERNLYGFTNAQKRSALQLNTARHIVQINVQTEASEENSTSRILFAERLENERQLALQYSVYYRTTHENTDRANWPPVVLLPLQSDSAPATTNTIVMDYDLLVYSPYNSGTYGKRRSVASKVPFAEYSGSMLSLMLRPHANQSITDRVSLGNMFFRRYNVHIDRVENTIEIVEKFATENLADVEVLGGLYLFVYFVFSLCRMMAYTVSLTVSLNRRCPVCAEPQPPYKQHDLPPSVLIIIGIVGDMLMLLTACWLLLHLETLLVDSALPDARPFLFWSWLLAMPNVLVILFVRFSSPAHRAPPDGSFCWRTFRWTSCYAACSEHLALFGLLWLSVILQTDTLGTTLSVLIAAMMFFSAIHHVVHIYLFEYDFATSLVEFSRRRIAELPAEKQSKQGNFPDAKTNLAWFGFVLVVLFLLNVLFSTFVLLRFIIVPVLNSVLMSTLVLGVAFLLALWMLDIYEKVTMSKTLLNTARY